MLGWEVAQAAEANNMSVVMGTLPVFGGLTFGGSVAAGAHGSGYNGRPAVPSDMVAEIVWVDASGEKHVATPESPEWNAMFSGMGLVGVMTEFVLQLKPYSHTHFKSIKEMPDDNMMDVVEKMLEEVRVCLGGLEGRGRMRARDEGKVVGRGGAERGVWNGSV